MTVRELICFLSDLPRDAEIVVEDGEGFLISKNEVDAGYNNITNSCYIGPSLLAKEWVIHSTNLT